MNGHIRKLIDRSTVRWGSANYITYVRPPRIKIWWSCAQMGNASSQSGHGSRSWHIFTWP